MTKQQISEYRKKHYTGIYGSWYAMKQRCNNPNNDAHKNYGGRGITYCQKWEIFNGFKEDMGGTYKKGLFIERIDNNKSYFKENCKWTTRKENNNNKRSNIVIEYQGQKMTLSQWCDLTGMYFETIRSRYYRGMNWNEILKTNLYRPQKLLN